VILMGRFKKASKVKKIRIGNLLSVGTISIVLIACFGLLGASYAAWTQSFDIIGTITTGHLDIAVRDVTLVSSDEYESFNFSVDRDGNIVNEVAMDVETTTYPFEAVVRFTVENIGTLPVVCNGIDNSVSDSVEVELMETPGAIEPGETAYIKVRIVKGYCHNFEFSTFLKFEQAV
jgi:hypothetical protein